jgi:hypothetical protein
MQLALQRHAQETHSTPPKLSSIASSRSSQSKNAPSIRVETICHFFTSLPAKQRHKFSLLPPTPHPRRTTKLNPSATRQKPAKTTLSTPKTTQPQQTKPHPRGTITPTHQLKFNERISKSNPSKPPNLSPSATTPAPQSPTPQSPAPQSPTPQKRAKGPTYTSLGHRPR